MALDLPNTPTDGQQSGGYVWSASLGAWKKTPDVASGLPAGTIMTWAGSSVPANWLLCDGSAVSRTAYPSLFAAIGTTYGVGDGSTTFNVPNRPNGYAAGRVARAVLTANATTTSTTAVALGAGLSVTAPVIAGRQYRINFDTQAAYSSIANEQIRFDIRAAGTTIKVHYAKVDTLGTSVSVFVSYTAATTGNVTFDVQWLRAFGSGTMTVQSDASNITELTVVDEAEAAALTKNIIKTSAGVTAGDSELSTRVGALEVRNTLPVYGRVPSTIVVGSGSASASSDGTITVSGCTTVSLNDIFDGTGADMYRITGVFDTSGSGSAVMIRQRKAGSDNSTNEYIYQYVAGTGGTSASQSGLAQQWYVQAGATGTGFTQLDFVIFRPKSTSARTTLIGVGQGLNIGTQYVTYTWGEVGPTTTKDCDGLTFIAGVGNLTGFVKVVKIG